MLVFAGITLVLIKVYFIKKFSYLDYSYITCIFKIVMLESDLTVLAFEVSYLFLSLNNYDFIVYFSI